MFIKGFILILIEMEEKKDDKNRSLLEKSVESGYSKDLVKKKEQEKKVTFNNGN